MKTCKWCGSTEHTSFYCFKKVKKSKKMSSKSGLKTKRRTKPLNALKTQNKRSAIKKKLDKLVKNYVKERDNYTCQKCGKKVEGVNCQASHVFPVGSCSKLQFEPLNMKVLCYHCHLNWWHKNPLEASEWFESKFPERLAILNVMKRDAEKIPTNVLLEMIEHYKNS